MKRGFILMFVVGMLIAFAHCKKDDNGDNGGQQHPMGQYHELYSKWWYNQAQFRGDHFFTPTDSVTGELEWIHHNQMVNNGIYHWYNTGDSMLVEIPGYPPLVFYFKYITEDSMAYAPNNEPENIYRFTTTEP